MSREPITHELKCHPEPFKAVKDGSKPFEWRKDDRGYLVWDTLQLREWSPDVKLEGEGEPVGYTGEILHRTVTYIIREGFGIPEGYCIMGLAQAPQSSPAPVICGCGDEIIANSDAECGNCAAIKGMEVDRLRALASPAPSVIEAGDAMENMMRRLRTQRDDEGILPTGNDFNGMDGLCAAWVAAKASRPSVTPKHMNLEDEARVWYGDNYDYVTASNQHAIRMLAAFASHVLSLSRAPQGVTVDQILEVVNDWRANMHLIEVPPNTPYSTGVQNVLRSRLSALLTK